VQPHLCGLRTGRPLERDEQTPLAREWLAEPGGGLRFECEAALKAFFADASGLEQLRANLEVLRREYLAQQRDAIDMVDSWLAGQLRFADRLQYTALSSDLIARLQKAVGEWAADWLERIEAWEATSPHPAAQEQARELIAAYRSELRASLVTES
jgi:hypothetical protein